MVSVLHLRHRIPQWIWIYLRWLLGWFLEPNQWGCIWSLPWYRFCLSQFDRRQKWWHCSPQAPNIQTTWRYFYRLPPGTPNRHRRNRRYTNAWWNCCHYRCTFQDRPGWVLANCSTRRAEWFFNPRGPGLLRWRSTRPARGWGVVAPSLSPSRCLCRGYVCACFISSFEFNINWLGYTSEITTIKNEYSLVKIYLIGVIY